MNRKRPGDGPSGSGKPGGERRACLGAAPRFFAARIRELTVRTCMTTDTPLCCAWGLTGYPVSPQAFSARRRSALRNPSGGPARIRACLKIGNMRNGEGFFCWSRQIFAGILCAFQENSAEKEPPFGRADIFQASPKEIPATDIKKFSSPPCQLPVSQPGVNLPHGPFPPLCSHRQQGGAAHRMEQ